MKSFLFSVLVLCSATQYAQVPGFHVQVQSGAPGGYYLTAPSDPVTENYHQTILDSTGEIIFDRKFHDMVIDFNYQSGRFTYFNGNKAYLCDGNLKVIDSITAGNGMSQDFHELQILPNGHFLMLAQETRLMDLSSYSYFLSNGSPGSKQAIVLANVIQELDTNKQVVFEWKLLDHLPFNSVDPYWLYDTSVVDWSHSNSLDLDADGNILISSRHFNEVAKVNRTTGAVMWRMGGNYNQFQFIGDTVRFYGQHDFRRLRSGRYSLFDNGQHWQSHPPRAVEYTINDTNMTATVYWQDESDTAISCYAMGNFQRMRNGRSLIDYGLINGDSILFDVVDQQHQHLLSVYLPGSFSYRSFHKNSLPAEFVRPGLSCRDSAGTMILDAGTGYLSHIWNNGAKGQLINVKAPGIYNVLLLRQDSSYIRSTPVVVSDPSLGCVATGIRSFSIETQMVVYPNPANEELNVRHAGDQAHIKIVDLLGRTYNLKTTAVTPNLTNVDISSLQAGIYIVTRGPEAIRFVRQ